MSWAYHIPHAGAPPRTPAKGLPLEPAGVLAPPDPRQGVLGFHTSLAGAPPRTPAKGLPLEPAGVLAPPDPRQGMQPSASLPVVMPQWLECPSQTWAGFCRGSATPNQDEVAAFWSTAFRIRRWLDWIVVRCRLSALQRHDNERCLRGGLAFGVRRGGAHRGVQGQSPCRPARAGPPTLEPVRQSRSECRGIAFATAWPAQSSARCSGAWGRAPLLRQRNEKTPLSNALRRRALHPPRQIGERNASGERVRKRL